MPERESAFRDAPFAFMDLLDATAPRGQRWRINTQDGTVCHLCFACDATFDQTDDGWRALREHELEHGAATVADLSEIDGRTLRMFAWRVQGKHSYSGDSYELWGVDDERGVVYCLSNAYQRETIWKWRIGSGHSGVLALLNAATLNDQG